MRIEQASRRWCACGSIGAALVAALGATPVRAGDPPAALPHSWATEFWPNVRLYGAHAFKAFDDGTGPALFIAGSMSQNEVPGSFQVKKWTGLGLVNLPSLTSVPGYIYGGGSKGLAVFDEDGAGPLPARLFLYGSFRYQGTADLLNIARWVPESGEWQPVGGGVDSDGGAAEGQRVYDALVFDDDGAGPHVPALYVAGEFDFAGGAPAACIAKWDGSAWTPLATSFVGTGGDTPRTFYKLAVFDEDGAGPQPARLFAAGTFISLDGVTCNMIARWDGAQWSSLGAGLQPAIGQVHARDLAVFDDGRGPGLFVSGYFFGVGSLNCPALARWNGTEWTDAGVLTLAASDARELSVHDDGEGPRLYARGAMVSPSPSGFAMSRWDGIEWEPWGEWHSGYPTVPGDSIGIETDGPFPSGMYSDYFRHEGGRWRTTGKGAAQLSGQAQGVMHDVVSDENEAGPIVYAAVRRSFGLTDGSLLAYDGSDWTAIETQNTWPLGPNDTVIKYDFDGAGPRSDQLASAVGAWDGSATVGTGVWNGVEWEGLTQFDPWLSISCHALFDEDGSGGQPPVLYVGGEVRNAQPGQSATRAYAARWTGSDWEEFGGGMTANNHTTLIDSVDAMVVHDDGTGPALYLAGRFAGAGGVTSPAIIRWRNGAWEQVNPLPAGDYRIYNLASMATDEGPALFADEPMASPALRGTTGAETPSRRSPSGGAIGMWRGGTWTDIEIPFEGHVASLAAYDDGSGASLFVAGGDQTSLYRVSASGDVSATGFILVGGVGVMRSVSEGPFRGLWLGANVRGIQRPELIDSVGIACYRPSNPPRFSRHPSDRTVPVGTTLTLRSWAYGAEPMQLKWRRNGEDLEDGGRFSGTGTRSLTITGAQASDTGLYEVHASNSAGEIESLGALVSVRAVPGAFSLSSPAPGQTDVQHSPATFSWQSASGASSYRLRVSVNSSTADPVIDVEVAAPQTSYQAASGVLNTSTAYYWTVLALNADGRSRATPGSSRFVTAPPAPGTFFLQTPASNAVNVPLTPLFNWTDSVNAASYQLRIDTDADLSDAPIVFSTTPSQYQMGSGVLQYSTTYYWTAVAINGAGGVAAPGRSFTTVPLNPPPGAFQLLTPTNNEFVATHRPTLDWSDANGAVSYALTIDDSADLSSPVVVANGLVATQYTPGAGVLKNHRTYYWAVTASNIGGNTTGLGSPYAFNINAPLCQGDANDDQVVSFADITAVLANWGGLPPIGDANGDGFINFVDVTTVLANWGFADCP